MKVPCEECLVFAACRTRYRHKPKFFMDEKFGGGIFDLAYDERCEHLTKYLENSDQAGVNEARILYDMDPY